eukprot:1092797-Rhodomonas_salina.1
MIEKFRASPTSPDISLSFTWLSGLVAATRVPSCLYCKTFAGYVVVMSHCPRPTMFDCPASRKTCVRDGFTTATPRAARRSTLRQKTASSAAASSALSKMIASAKSRAPLYEDKSK